LPSHVCWLQLFAFLIIYVIVFFLVVLPMNALLNKYYVKNSNPRSPLLPI
jgi:hypothetical protein